GNDALRAQSFGEQRLPDGVVDLVRARVREVLTLQPDLRAPALGKVSCAGERGRPAHPGFELIGEFSLEIGAVQVFTDAVFEPLERRDERLRHIAATERTEAATRIGEAARQLIG